MTQQEGPGSASIDRAHTLYNDGQADEARKIVEALLQREPGNREARALRDKMDTEEMSAALKREQKEKSDLFDDEDTSPIILIGLSVIGVGSIIAALSMCYRPITLGLKMGFGAQITSKDAFGIWGGVHIPVHLLFIYPVIFFFLGGMALYAVFRYSRQKS